MYLYKGYKDKIPSFDPGNEFSGKINILCSIWSGWLLYAHIKVEKWLNYMKQEERTCDFLKTLDNRGTNKKALSTTL